MRGKQTPVQTPVPGVFPGGCLVLVPGSEDAPKSLLNALASRGLAPSVVHDEPSVMTALAGKTRGRRVLVVVDPDRCGRLEDLIYAVQVYHGDVLCWQYATEKGEEKARLSALKPDLSGDKGQGPIGQIVGRKRPVDDLLVKLPGVQAPTHGIVTPEELTMLLGPAPGEAS